MARVIVIVGLMIAITVTMFAITRKSTVAPGEAANGPITTVKLDDLPPPGATATPAEEAKIDEEQQSLTSVDPRPVINPVDGIAPEAQSAQDVTKGPVAGAAPSVGTAGINDKGRASFTGTATPGDTVSIVWDGKPLATTTADASGNWEVEFKAPVGKSDHELYASAQAKDGSVIIGPQRASIRPPSTEGGLPRITIKSADQVATTLQEGNVAAPEPKTGLIVEKITNAETGLTILTGKADPGATVKAAINGKPAGDTRVAADGSWTLAATNPSGKAADSVRLELIDREGAKIDEANLPHKVLAASPKIAAKEPETKPDVPAVFTSTPPAPTTKPETAGAKDKPEGKDLATLIQPTTTAEPERPKRKIIRVRRGDSLWRISKRHLGKGRKWAAFYKANKAKIDNPDLIYPGQTLIIPG
jgi:nucleoid-associated protein YgaU